MSKRKRDLIKELESIGYVYDRTNGKGVDFYIHEDSGAEVRLPVGVDEASARKCLTYAYHDIGLPTKTNKRNPAAIRQHAERQRAAAKQTLEKLRDQRALILIDNAELRQLEESLMRAERKFKYWDRLMRTPA